MGGDVSVSPGQTFQFDLLLRYTERSSSDLIDPTLVDVLPDNLEFVSWDSIAYGNVPVVDRVEPNLEVLNNFTVDGTTHATVLRWTWQDPAPAGSVDINGNPGVSNAWTLTPPPTGNRDIVVRYTVRVRAGTPPGNYNNLGKLLTDSPGNSCEISATNVDVDDLDGDGDTTETVCDTTRDYDVQEAAVLDSRKWIQNPTFPGFVNPINGDVCPNDGLDFTRYPCVAQGFPENTDDTFDDFVFKLVIENLGNVPITDWMMYDIFPYIGDTGSGGPLNTTARLSEFQPFLLGPVTVTSPAGITPIIEYSNSSNPCRTEVFSDGAVNNEPAGCVNDWSATPPTTFTDVRAFRAYFEAPQSLGLFESMEFIVPMRIPADAESGEIAWNSFAQRFTNASSGTRLPTAEPRKVGIIVPERLSIGNRVWFDSNDSGTIDAADGATPGAAGVTVNLYLDTDNDGIPDSPTPVATDVTDAEGYYLFSDLDEGRYVVAIPNSNFNPGQPLNSYFSSTGSTGDTGTDSDDNGLDTPDATFGILSNSILLGIDAEPTGEADLSNDDADGLPGERRGTRGETDDNSDLTIDFGFVQPLSLGNRVWLDDGQGGGGFNNGVQDGTEPGIAGVTLNLYLDSNGNNVPDAENWLILRQQMRMVITSLTG